MDFEPAGTGAPAAAPTSAADVERIYREMGPRLRRTAERLLRDAHEAEDVAQETMLAAWRGAGGLRDPRCLEAWLVRIAKNLAITRLRRRLVRPPAAVVAGAADDGEGRSASPWDEVADPEPPVEAVVCVRHAFDGAPPSWRRAFRDRVERGRTFEQIACDEGVTVSCVKTRLSRLAKSLRDSL